MSNFGGAIVCVICLAIANFGVEAFREVSDYSDAIKTTWNQVWAVGIYYFIWVND